MFQLQKATQYFITVPQLSLFYFVSYKKTVPSQRVCVCVFTADTVDIFDVSLTVHLSTILVINQLNAQNLVL